MRIQAQRLADGEHELFMESHIDPKIFKVEKKYEFLQHFKWIRIWIQGFDDKKLKKKKIQIWSKIAISLCPSYRRSVQPSKGNIHYFKKWNLLFFFYVYGSFFPPGSGYGSRDLIESGSNPDSDTDPDPRHSFFFLTLAIKGTLVFVDNFAWYANYCCCRSVLHDWFIPNLDPAFKERHIVIQNSKGLKSIDRVQKWLMRHYFQRILTRNM